MASRGLLLIEPIGIEIFFAQFLGFWFLLLIEPIGIEIFIGFVGLVFVVLLIEPIGIEMSNSPTIAQIALTLLIEPIGIEICWELMIPRKTLYF